MKLQKILKAAQTMRWYLAPERADDPLSVKKAYQLSTAIIDTITGAKSVPAETVSGKVKLWLDCATKIGPKALTRGRYARGYPLGAVVHFTAGNPAQKGSDAMAFQKKSGMCYFFIDAKGEIFQNFPLDLWGYHAGKSAWPGIAGSVSNKLVGIEIACPGKLNNRNQTSWSRPITIPSEQVRTSANNDNILAGNYAKFTTAQEVALKKLLKELHDNNPAVFSYDRVLGHDEVSGPKGIGYHRKNDPGASLSTTMSQLREELKKS